MFLDHKSSISCETDFFHLHMKEVSVMQTSAILRSLCNLDHPSNLLCWDVEQQKCLFATQTHFFNSVIYMHSNFFDLPSISSTFYMRIFGTKFWRQKVSKPKQSFVIFGAKMSYKIHTCKTLMKLTPTRLIFSVFPN